VDRPRHWRPANHLGYLDAGAGFPLTAKGFPSAAVVV
jgi:hypothetical protein